MKAKKQKEHLNLKKRNSKTPPSADSASTAQEGLSRSSPDSVTSALLSFNSEEKSPLGGDSKLSREAETFDGVFSSEIAPSFNKIENLDGSR